ncbi:MAG: hypothetical protein KBA75_07115 [Alphaproteobacteria bacterium]|nr:hypothetical protein [Alphaproteobacteria bacterium]
MCISQNSQLITRKNENGIAIGPILFVVALLGILAAAIAAGSGSFTGSSAKESAKAKAAAIVETGQHLKFGWDKITNDGIAPENVVIDPTSTSSTTDLYSPSGGGITPPSNVLASSGRKWCFGETTSNPVAAVLPVDETVCKEINRLTFGSAVAPAGSIVITNSTTCQFDDYAQVFDTATTLPSPIPPGTRSFCVTGEVDSDTNHGLFVQILHFQ